MVERQSGLTYEELPEMPRNNIVHPIKQILGGGKQLLKHVHRLSSTVIWLYFALKVFRTLLFRAVLISYALHIIYETRVKVLLLKIFVRLIFVRTAAYENK